MNKKILGWMCEDIRELREKYDVEYVSIYSLRKLLAKRYNKAGISSKESADYARGLCDIGALQVAGAGRFKIL